MPAVDGETGTITAAEVREFADVRGSYTSFLEGDVIFAKITPCMENGKAAVALGLINGHGFGSSEFHVLRPTGAALADYLHRYVRQEFFRSTAAPHMTGSVGQKRVPVDFLREAPLPLAPFREQQRIVKQVERLLAGVNACRARLSTIPASLKRLRQSVLDSAFSGALTRDWRDDVSASVNVEEMLEGLREDHAAAKTGHGGRAASPTEDVHTLSDEDIPQGWALAELKVLCTPGRPITYGILKPGPDFPEGILYVRVADYPNDKLSLEKIKRTSPDIAGSYRRSELLAGDILLSIRGTVGRVCRVPEELAGANITQDTARVSVDPRVNPDYVEWYLRSPTAQHRFEKALKGVAVRGINLGDVRALQVALPSREEQDEIVRRINDFVALGDSVDESLATATAGADDLTQAILASAFRGELVPTEAELAKVEGRDLEPASKLLEGAAGEGSHPAGDPRTNGGTVKSRRAMSKNGELSLVETLSAAKRKMAPEELFSEAGFDKSKVADIEAFYDELRIALRGGLITEERPDAERVLLAIPAA